MTYWALGCVQKCDLWAWRRNEKKDKLSCVKLAICPDHPRRHRPLKFCMPGRVRKVVIYFKFHENRSRGLRAVDGRKISLSHWLGPWHNGWYYRTSRDSCSFGCLRRSAKRCANEFSYTKNYEENQTILVFQIIHGTKGLWDEWSIVRMVYTWYD